MFIYTFNAAAQDTLTVIPGPEYSAGSIHRFFFGDHWRDVWTTPVEVPILQLDSFAGGLIPYEKGGGFQTKSLRFKSGDGRIFKFRSLNKDPQKLLPDELQKSVAASVLKDQISSAHPYAAIPAAYLLNVVGILNAKPILVKLPDSDKLGQFKEEFGGITGMLEEHPEVSDDDSVGFGGAHKIKGTIKLLHDMEKDNSNFVSGEEFLTARLMDIWLGDWDRHVDQWRWAGYKQGRKTAWYPIPRDRDQVFSKFDGILPWIVENAVPQLEGFRDFYPEIEDMTWSGRFLDRRFLIPVTKSKWDSVTEFVMNKLTNEVIEKAIQQFPADIYRISGKEIIEKLKARRDKLKEASEEYYDLVFSYVNIYGSDKEESALVNRIDDDHVEVFIYDKGKVNGEKNKGLLFHRIFRRSETSEINIDLLGGSDEALITGSVTSSILIRVIGGKGKDKLTDSSHVCGYFLSSVPFIPSAERKTYFYDEGKQTEIVESTGTKVNRDEYPEPETEEEKYQPKVRDWGYDWKFKPLFDYSSDEGLLLGGGPVLYNFRFRTEPYLYRMHLLAGYAFKHRAYIIDYKGEFYGVIPGVKIGIQLSKSELSILNFYGKGNETIMNDDLERIGYYDSQREENTAGINAGFSPFTNFYFKAGTAFKYSETKLAKNTLIDSLKPHGINDDMYTEVRVELTYDTREHNLAPFSGMLLRYSGLYVPKLIDNPNAYSKSTAEARYYFTSNILTRSVIALRVKGEKLWGSYPYYQSAFIGGTNSIRGYNRERFAGDASLELNAEVRSFLFRANILVPAMFGLSLSAESGRIFNTGERSDKWHTGIGSGIWTYLVTRDVLFSLSYVKSPEDYGLYLQYGFTF